MTHTPRRPGSRDLLAAVSAAVLALAVTSCAPNPHAGPPAAGTPPRIDQQHRAPSPPAVPAGVDTNNPDSVATAVLTAAATADTTRDTHDGAGLLRVTALLTPAVAASVATAPTTTDSDWQQWSTHRAVTTVTLAPDSDDRLPDTPTRAYRAWIVTRTPVGRDGWRGPPQQQIALVTLTRAGNAWAVSNIDYH